MRSIAGWLARHATFAPDKPAIVSADGTLDYAGLAARVATLAGWLRDERGLAPGARVEWLGHNHADLLALLFACADTGLVLVPLNWRLTAHELDRVLDDAGAALVVVETHRLRKIRPRRVERHARSRQRRDKAPLAARRAVELDE